MAQQFMQTVTENKTPLEEIEEMWSKKYNLSKSTNYFTCTKQSGIQFCMQISRLLKVLMVKFIKLSNYPANKNMF